MRSSLFATLLFLSTSAVFAQPAQQLAVRVVNAATSPPRPVSGVRVSLVRTIAGTVITAGVARSDRSGRALFEVPQSFLSAYDVRLQLVDEGTLVIYEPAEGGVDGRDLHSRNLVLKLLPRGSPSLLGPAQLEALIARLSTAEPRAAAREDITRSLRRWAQQAGFTLSEVEAQLRQWVVATRKNSDSATKQQLALAEFADRDFLSAAALFGEAAELEAVELEQSIRARDEADEKERAALKQFLGTRVRQAIAFERALRFEDARKSLDAAVERIDKTRHRDLWIDLKLNRAISRRQDAENRTSPQESEPLFTGALLDYQDVLNELTNAQDPRDRYAAAVARRDLATVLVKQAIRLPDAQALNLYQQATAIFRDALNVLTRSDYPLMWGETQTNIGIVLHAQADRGQNQVDVTRLLLQSEQAFREALQVLTEPEADRARALAQESLASTLADLSKQSNEPTATAHVVQAIDLLRAVLNVYDRTTMPIDWARAQNHLADALFTLAHQRKGAESIDLLTQAVEAYNATLRVKTRANVPHDWGLVQNELGMAYVALAERSSGPEASEYIERAADAYRASLEIFTRESLPLYWAGLQMKLGLVCHFRARHSGDTNDSVAQRKEAIDAYRSASEVFSKDVDPFQFGLLHFNIGEVKLEDALDSRDGAEVQAWSEAMAAYHSALQVLTKAHWPSYWALVQSSRGLALLNHADRLDDAKERDVCLREAVVAYDYALQVIRRDQSPNEYLRVQFGLSRVLSRLRDWEGAAVSVEGALSVVPDNASWLLRAAQIYQEHLFLFDRALELNERLLKASPSLPNRIDYAEKLLTTARFHDCVAYWNGLSSEISGSNTVLRDSLRFACEAGARDFTAAAKSSQTLIAMAEQLDKPKFRFGGTKHFLSTHPMFREQKAWRQLFERIESGDGRGMADAVREIQKSMVN